MRTFRDGGMLVPVRVWDDGVPMEHEVLNQMRNIASLPVVTGAALMPDGHFGIGGPVGGVVVTHTAIIPAVTGVDLGCGMMCVQTDLSVNALDGKLPAIRAVIEDQIPVGGPGIKGSWDARHGTPQRVYAVWGNEFEDGFKRILSKHPKLKDKPTWNQLGTLGTGNHFIEVCRDLATDDVWLMLHSGSRGVGNRIGTYFINQAREAALRLNRHLSDRDLAWLDEGTPLFVDYIEAVGWAQRYARRNRDLMMERVVSNLRHVLGREFRADLVAVNCHHNYVEEERGLYITRKGAVSAKLGELGIIPGSMGAKSFIVRGKGNEESFQSCSHGAGRRMSRGAAKRAFTEEDHEKATAGVECRKDAGVIDETPAAYKSIEAVMAAQSDLVEIVATLKQLVCVKG